MGKEGTKLSKNRIEPRDPMIGWHSFLQTVDCKNKKHINFLYKMLKQRDKNVNISHVRMPTKKEHKKFVESNPYWKWKIIFYKKKMIGYYYLTTKDNLSGRAIGIFIDKRYQKKGIGTKILEWIITTNTNERLLANISPKNISSQKIFEGFGFKKIQHTYELK